MDKPTILTLEDIDKFVDICMNTEIPRPKCNWCEKSTLVREVGPNHICEQCEKEERVAGRPLIFTSPVSDTYWCEYSPEFKAYGLKDGYEKVNRNDL
jgi:hypothetical protein